MITRMNDFEMRAVNLADTDAMVALYQAVAAMPGSGLARQRGEISREYVAGFLARALNGGVSLGAFAGDAPVGEIHATRIGPRQFAHVLTDLTVAVHPDVQGRGVGSRCVSTNVSGSGRKAAFREESGSQTAISRTTFQWRGSSRDHRRSLVANY